MGRGDPVLAHFWAVLGSILTPNLGVKVPQKWGHVARIPGDAEASSRRQKGALIVEEL